MSVDTLPSDVLDEDSAPSPSLRVFAVTLDALGSFFQAWLTEAWVCLGSEMGLEGGWLRFGAGLAETIGFVLAIARRGRWVRFGRPPIAPIVRHKLQTRNKLKIEKGVSVETGAGDLASGCPLVRSGI